MTEGHIVSSYDSEMHHLHQLVIRLSEMAREQLRLAVRTLQDEDLEAARAVMERDREINDLDIQADEEIFRLIARRQPMARDLREILTASKIVSDLERIGDQARRIARLTVYFYAGDKNPPNSQLLSDLPRMAEYVDQTVELAIQAFDELDLELALETMRRDARIDDEFKASLRRLSTYLMEDSRSVGNVIDVVLGLRSMERISAYARNIARYVAFLVKGKDMRHEGLESLEREVSSSGPGM